MVICSFFMFLPLNDTYCFYSSHLTRANHLYLKKVGKLEEQLDYLGTTTVSCITFSQHTFVVQPLNCVHIFATPWTAAYQASLSFTISPNFLKLMSIESVMPSNHLILLILKFHILFHLVFPHIFNQKGRHCYMS